MTTNAKLATQDISKHLIDRVSQTTIDALQTMEIAGAEKEEALAAVTHSLLFCVSVIALQTKVSRIAFLQLCDQVFSMTRQMTK